MTERMLSTAEVAAIVGVGVDTLEKWRASGDGPPWHRFGRTVGGRGRQRARSLPRYRRSDVEAWIASKSVTANHEEEAMGATVIKKVLRPSRSMLVIGDSLADARHFIGNAETTNPRMLAIPDDVWHPSEALEGAFCVADAIPAGRAFDIVVVTLRAGSGGLRAGVILEASARVQAGGILWMEPPSVAP